MSSQKSSPPAEPQARKPVRRRGQARVQSLLDAAEQVIATRGFDAATMTEIADVAGASIGSLYQYFPTKELVAEALHAELIGLLEREIASRASAAPTAATRAILIMEGFAGLVAAHPAFPMLADRRSLDKDKKAVYRARLRHRIAETLSGGAATEDEGTARTMAILLLAVMRTMSQLAAEGDSEATGEAIVALKDMVCAHIANRIGG